MRLATIRFKGGFVGISKEQALYRAFLIGYLTRANACYIARESKEVWRAKYDRV